MMLFAAASAGSWVAFGIAVLLLGFSGVGVRGALRRRQRIREGARTLKRQIGRKKAEIGRHRAVVSA